MALVIVAILGSLLLGVITVCKELVPEANSDDTALVSDPPMVLPYSGKNWGIWNRNGSDMQVPCAWASEGNNDVIVATIDTGVDTRDHIFNGHLWSNPMVPSEFGWDFIHNKSNPRDFYGHGTHVASTILEIAHHVKIMALKYSGGVDGLSAKDQIEESLRALNWAIDHGAQVINYSGGGPEFWGEEYLAIRQAEQKGIVVVAAAGNNHANTDLEQNYYYPGDYHLSNEIVVTGYDYTGGLAEDANYGKKNIDVAAPGENIYAALPNNRFGYMTGTSMATAMTTGVVALMLEKNPNLTPQQIKTILIQTSTPNQQLKDKTASGGTVNACAALASVP